MFIFLVATFTVVLTMGILAIACEQRLNNDGELNLNGDDGLRYIPGDVTLVADPVHVKLESGNQIHFSVSVTNSGSEPILAWALDLGNQLYLVKAEPREDIYHKGGPHGRQSGNQIHFSVSVTNSGSEPILAGALNPGNQLYLVKAEPGKHSRHEDEHEHNGNHEEEHGHGNVLIYAIPIDSGKSLRVELTLRVLFDIEGKFEPNPELRLFYARGAKDTQTLVADYLQKFQNTFLAYPLVVASLHIER